MFPSTTNTFTFKLEVLWRDSSGNPIETRVVKTYSASTPDLAPWDQATMSLIAPPETVSAQVRMVVSRLDATIYVDDFELIAGTSTATSNTFMANHHHH